MVMVACWTMGLSVCTDEAIPPKSAATWGIVFDCRFCTSPLCTARMRERVLLDSSSRSGAVNCDSVLHVAARAEWESRPYAQTKSALGSTRLQFMHLKGMAGAYNRR